MPRASKTNVDLTETEAQQLHVATQTPAKGGRQDTSLPQAAQIIPSFLIKKSMLFLVEHLQASLPTVPFNKCASPLLTRA
jgi:hypothetical protein